MKMETLQRDYLNVRQELYTRLQHAVRSHEVNTDPVTLSLPGLGYPPATIASMPNPATASMTGITQPSVFMPPTTAMFDNSAMAASGVILDSDAYQAPPAVMTSLPMQQFVMPPVSNTTAVPITAAAGGRYHIINPDGSQQVIQINPHQLNQAAAQATPLTVVTTSVASSAASATSASGSMAT